jgi:hypothetical protein
MTNQKAARDATSTTTIGTTIAGINVFRFEEDFWAAALLVAAAEVVEVVCVAVVGEEAAAAEVIEA